MDPQNLPLDLLERLSNACGVSGDEGEVRKIVLEAVKPLADEVKVDALGNVLAIKKARGEPALRVMLAAHMDEVGLMIVDEEEGGLYKFEIVGGIDPRQLPGKPVWVGKDRLPGVIGARPIHLTTPEERKSAIAAESLRIDLGPEGGKKAKPGDRAVFATPFKVVGPSVMGKALDDRLGVATLITLLERAPSHLEFQAAFTVQEEIGLRGARVAAYTLNPDLAFALDATPANDLPTWDGSENTTYNARLGHGPAVYVADGATLSDPRLVRFLLQTAAAHHIPYQIRQPGGGGTDAGAIHRQRSGIPSASVSVPIRHAHSAVAVARLDDWANTINLMLHTLQALTPDILAPERS
jgi:endoglucanase